MGVLMHHGNPMIRLAAALGNPGNAYARTRHNLGEMVLLAYVKTYQVNWKTKFHSRYAKLPDTQLHMIIPNTFMNLCGKAVSAACSFFSVPPDELIILHDDLELPFGWAEVRKDGGLGGHNGLRSITGALGSRDFYRLRLGIGRPERGSVSSFVLSRFTPDEESLLDTYITRGAALFASSIDEFIPPEQKKVWLLA